MNLSTACQFTNVTRLRFNATAENFSAETRNPALIALLLSWDVSLSIWAGYDAVGKEFAQPADAQRRYALWLWDAEKRRHLVLIYTSDTTPNHACGYAFRYDKSQENNGMTHPVRVWLMDLFDVELLKAGMGITTAPTAYVRTLLAENVLRERPRTKGGIVATLPAGTAVTVVGSGVNYDGCAWLPVRVGDCAGWLSVSATSIG